MRICRQSICAHTAGLHRFACSGMSCCSLSCHAVPAFWLSRAFIRGCIWLVQPFLQLTCAHAANSRNTRDPLIAVIPPTHFSPHGLESSLVWVSRKAKAGTRAHTVKKLAPKRWHQPSRQICVPWRFKSMTWTFSSSSAEGRLAPSTVDGGSRRTWKWLSRSTHRQTPCRR